MIDWTRTDPRTDAPVANDSRLHERQPGALIFRKQEREKVRLQIVLLALETPTSGVHRAALRNAITFIRAWQTCAGPSGKADLALSLGKMTLPHRIARLVLFEQVYRSFTILRGEPYYH